MKFTSAAVILAFALLLACTHLPESNDNHTTDNKAITASPGLPSKSGHQFSTGTLKTVRELHIVKSLQLRLLKSIADENISKNTYRQLESLALENNALESNLGVKLNQTLPKHSERAEVSVLQARVTNEELRLKNFFSYQDFKKRLQAKVAVAQNIPLYTPSQLTPRQAVDIEQNKLLVIQEIAMALDAWPIQKPALRQAERQISDLIAVAPDYASVWVQLARWHLKRVEHDGLKYRFQRHQRVKEAVVKAMALDPKNGNAWSIWGELAIQHQQWYLAKERLQKAVDLKASDPWLAIRLGQVAEHFNQPNTAYKHYRIALKQQRSNYQIRSFPKAVAWGHLARLHLRRGDIRKAQDAFDTQIEYTPRAGIAKSRYADELLYAAGEYDRVIELAEKLGADVSPETHAMAHYLRWSVHAKRGNSANAMQSLIKAQQILADLNHAMSLVGRFRQRDSLQLLTSHLVSQGVNINAKNREGYTALHIAVLNDNAIGIESLIDKAADIDSLDNNDYSPVLIAVRRQKAHLVELLIELGANPEQHYKINEATPLVFAILNEDINTVKVLLASNVDIDTRDRHGLSPLTLAASTGNRAVIREIADVGGEFRGKIDGRWTAIEFANLIGDQQLAHLIRAINQ